MKPLVHQIKEKLDREIKEFRTLLSIVEQERDILLTGDHKKLIPTTQRKLEIGRQLADAQAERRELLQNLSTDRTKPLRLKDLIPYLPESDREPFRSTLSHLNSLAGKITALSSSNRGYVEEALSTVEHMLSILTGADNRGAYANQGPRTKSMGPRILAREV